MAQENEIVLKLRMTTAEAEKGLEKVQKNIKDTNKELKTNIDNFGMLGVTIGDVKGKFADLRKIAGQALTVVAQQGKQALLGMRLMFGGKMKTGASALFKTIKMGIAATGIGLLVVAFTSLVSYFTKTKKGAEVLSVAMKGVGAAVSAIIDRVSRMGKAVAKLLKGDFKGAAKEATGVFKGLGDEIQREVKLAMELEKASQKLRDQQRELNVETAQRRAEIEGLKLIAEDVTKSEAERVQAAKDAFAIEQDLMDRRVAAAEEDVRIAKERIAMGESSAEDLDELAEKEIALADIKGESLGKSIELNNKINSIEKEIADKRAANHQAELDRIQEEKDAAEELAKAKLAIEDQITLAKTEEGEARELKALELDHQRKLAEVEDKDLRKLMETKYAMDKAAIVKKYADAEAEATKEAEAKKVEVAEMTADAKAQLAMQGLGLLADAVGRETAVGKAAAVAETIISTYKSAQSSYASMSGIPVVGPALGAVASGMAIASGMATVQKIIATPEPNTDVKLASGGIVGGYGSGTSDSVRARLSKKESVINARSTRMFRSELSAINVAGGGRAFTGEQGFDEGSMGMTGGVMKAYVVADEMTKSQDRLNKIRRKSTI